MTTSQYCTFEIKLDIISAITLESEHVYKTWDRIVQRLIELMQVMYFL